jgi:CRISPR-associated protein Cas1
VIRLIDRVAELDNLDRAWRDLEANDAADGEIRPATARFAVHRFEALAELSELLRTDQYRPSAFTEIASDKPDGGTRSLHLSDVVDRIVERAVAQVLTPVLDPLFGPWSFAYRPGLGVPDAVTRLVELRADGCTQVVRADIRDCFPSIATDVLLERVADLVDDPAVVALIRQLLGRPVRGRSPDQAVPGLPQGSPLSPLLANLFLADLDDRLLEARLPAVRYADDLVLPVPEGVEPHRCRARLKEVTASMGLELPHDGGEVMSFTEGFAFLGEEFTAEWPPDALVDPVVREPDKRVLYVSHQGSLVRTSKGQMLVEVESETALQVPLTMVSRVVLFGAVSLSAGARGVALDNHIDVVMLSRRGRHQGVLTAGGARSARLRRFQFAESTDERTRVRHARAFVSGKVTNQVALLQRYAVGAPESYAAPREQLTAVRPLLASCAEIDVLLGVEGAAARNYFQAFGLLLPEGFRFDTRSRRPPMDPVNAALSFGYALLTGEAVSAAAAAWLDPSIGFLHGDDDGRPSLALDLMEEFRPLIVDTTVLNLFRRGRLSVDHFRVETDRPGVLLTDEGRRRFLDAFEERMLTVFAHVPSGKRVSYRRSIYLQAVQFAAVLAGREYAYRPVVWR